MNRRRQLRHERERTLRELQARNRHLVQRAGHLGAAAIGMHAQLEATEDARDLAADVAVGHRRGKEQAQTDLVHADYSIDQLNQKQKNWLLAKI